MSQKIVRLFSTKAVTMGTHDAIIDDEVVRDIPSKLVFVSSSDELTDFAAVEPAGTIAATYGFGSMWQLKPDGTWAEI